MIHNPSLPLEIVQLRDGAHFLVARVTPPDEPIPGHAILGRLELRDDQPDWSTLVPNPAFIEVLVGYLRGDAPEFPEGLTDARGAPNAWLYTIDPRHVDPSGTVPPTEIVGAYETDPEGRPHRPSFTYNPRYLLVRPDGTLTQYAHDPRFARVLAGHRPDPAP